MTAATEGALERLRGGPQPLLWLAAFAVAVYAAGFADSYSLRVLTVAGCYALMVLGYQFIFGHGGGLSLAQGTFFGLGAYVTGLMGSQLGAQFPVTFPLSVAAPALLAAIIAVPVLKLESHYFALATLGIGQVVLIGTVDWESLTGGSNGLTGVPRIVLFGLAVPRGWPQLAFVWVMVAFGGLLAWQMLRGLYGIGFTVMRNQPMAGAAAGLNGAQRRYAAFILSAAFGGAGGALFIHGVGVVSPEVLEFPVMVACLSMAVIGGRTKVAGAVLGAVLLIHLPEWFRFLEHYYLLAYGAGLLLVVVLAPDGLVGLLEAGWRRAIRFVSDSAGERPSPPIRPPAPITFRAEAGERLPSTVLSVRGLSKSFGGVAAVAGIDLSLRRGEILGLIGPNGSGKTTLVNALTGHEPADAGLVTFEGRTIGAWPAFQIARVGIARTFQSVTLVDGLTALDNVAVARTAAEGAGLWAACRTLGRDGCLERARSHALALLNLLGVADAADAPCHALPHAARRKVELARALALDPVLLILDEPAAGLTNAEQQDLAGHLRLLRDRGLTLVIVEHNMPFLMPLADQMACLDEGRLIAKGTPDTVAADRAVVEAYLGPFGDPRSGAQGL